VTDNHQSLDLIRLGARVGEHPERVRAIQQFARRN
jgi:hypothetical protein